ACRVEGKAPKAHGAAERRGGFARTHADVQGVEPRGTRCRSGTGRSHRRSVSTGARQLLRGARIPRLGGGAARFPSGILTPSNAPQPLRCTRGSLPPIPNVPSAQAVESARSLFGSARAHHRTRVRPNSNEVHMKTFITRTAAIAVLSAGALLAQGPMDHSISSGATSTSTGTLDVTTIVAHEVTFLTHLLT